MNENAKQAAFDPYHKWLGIPPSEQPPTHYRLLGIQEFESDEEVISGAVWRQSAHLKTYQLGQHAALTQKLLNEVSAAKVCLLDPERKAAYDAQLRKDSQLRDKASQVRVLSVAEPLRPAAASVDSPAKAIRLEEPETVSDEPAQPLVNAGLRDLIGEIQASGGPARSTLKRHGRSSKSSRNRILAAGGAVALAIVVLIAVFFAVQTRDSTGSYGRETGKTQVVSSSGGSGSSNSKPVQLPTPPDTTGVKPGGNPPRIDPDPPDKPKPEIAPPFAVAPFDTTKAKEHQGAWAKQLGVSVEIANSLGMVMIFCPPGKFTMGSPTGERGRFDDENQVAVSISQGFYLGKYSVTQAEFKAVMNLSPWVDRPDVLEGKGYPATWVDWNDAAEFCRKLTERESRAGQLRPGYRYDLPSEAQREYACRADTMTAFSFGDNAGDLNEYAWFRDNSMAVGEKYAHRVGQKRPNAWGFSDMHGDIWEWCGDCYSANLRGATDPFVDGPSGSRVYRGGSVTDDVIICRSARRNKNGPSFRNFNLGFRVALVPADTPIQPTFVERFDKDHEDSRRGDLVKAGAKDGVYYYDSRRPGKGWAAWNFNKYHDGIIEVTARVGEGCKNGWIVHMENPEHRQGVAIVAFADGRLLIGPDMFHPDKSAGPPQRWITHPAIKQAGDWNTLRLVIAGKTLAIFVNSQQVCEPISLGFDLAPGILALGYTNDNGRARVEFQCYRLWPTTDISRMPDKTASEDAKSAAPNDAANPAIAPFEAERAHEHQLANSPTDSASATQQTSIAHGLDWLVRHQMKDGCWSLTGFSSKCSGPACSDLGDIPNTDSGATALALLALLGSQSGNKSANLYEQNVRGGVDWLVNHQLPNGNLASGAHQMMYSHGLATFALCEAYSHSKDPKLKGAAQKGVNFISSAQNRIDGGWRYDPGDAGDTSVLGWQMSALKSAQSSGLHVQSGTVTGAAKFLNSVSHANGAQYGYQPGIEALPPMSAVGLLCRPYLRVPLHGPMMTQGVKYLSNNSPNVNERNIYYWYYASRVMRGVGGKQWLTWRNSIHSILLGDQVKTPGNCANGSWDAAADPWGKHGGRLMMTSLAIMILQLQ